MSRLAEALDRVKTSAALPAPDAAAASTTGGAAAAGAPAMPAVIPAEAAAAEPLVGRLGVFQDFSPRLRHTLVTSEIQPVGLEQYRRLGATLHHVQAERGTKVVLIASAVAAEGKTLTATNLALTLSESYGRRVLLVDADLRRPALHDVFQVPNAVGLGTHLRGSEPNGVSVIHARPRLSLLTAGPPDSDPMGALTSGRMPKLIAEARAVFDWVILDTPPVALLSDARLIADMADATILVIRAGRTPFEMIQRAVRALDPRRIIGTVLNGVDTGGMSDYEAYQEYYTAPVSRTRGARNR
jgi:receptor protein-tyrosine kinase